MSNTYAELAKTYHETRKYALAAGVTLPYAWLMNSRVFAALIEKHPNAKARRRMAKERVLIIGSKASPVVLDEGARDVYYLPIKQINSEQLRRHRTPPALKERA